MGIELQMEYVVKCIIFFHEDFIILDFFISHNVFVGCIKLGYVRPCAHLVFGLEYENRSRYLN